MSRQRRKQMSYLDQVVSYVANEQDAQEVIAVLTEKFASTTARERLAQEGRLQHRSVREVAYRTAGNLLRSARTRRTDW